MGVPPTPETPFGDLPEPKDWAADLKFPSANEVETDVHEAAEPAHPGPKTARKGRRSARTALIPPPDVTGDALDEWDRVIAAVKKTGRTLKPADLSLLTLYVRTWTVNQTVYRHVVKWGPVVIANNGYPGQSPQYKAFIETGKQLRELLDRLGCTPASRDFDAAADAKKPAAAKLPDF